MVGARTRARVGTATGTATGRGWTVKLERVVHYLGISRRNIVDTKESTE